MQWTAGDHECSVAPHHHGYCSKGTLRAASLSPGSREGGAQPRSTGTGHPKREETSSGALTGSHQSCHGIKTDKVNLLAEEPESVWNVTKQGFEVPHLKSGGHYSW